MNAPEQSAVSGGPPAAPAWPAGHHIGGFELVAVAACHGTSIVYRARDLALGRQVAVKEYLPAMLARRDVDGLLHPADAQSTTAYERGLQAFIDEASLMARCDHPSLARVLHLFRAHGTAYRVMPWYEGRPLLEVRREMPGPPDEAALRTLLDELLGALHAWHRLGMPHGGMHPTQILLLPDDTPLLLGPGAVQRVTTSAAVESLMRQLEPSFAAPEQRIADGSGPALGPWTDFYALAEVARWCISGMLPPPTGWPQPEPLTATVERLYFDRPAVRYSATLLLTLDAATSPRISERPQSVAQFREWLSSGPPSARVAAGPAGSTAAAAPTPAAIPTPAPAAAAAAALADIRIDPPAHASAPVDAETADLIQRVIESIPPAPARSTAGKASSTSAANPSAAMSASASASAFAGTLPPLLHDIPSLRLDDTRRPVMPPKRRRGQRQGARWAVAALVVVAGVGYGAWQAQLVPQLLPQWAKQEQAERAPAAQGGALLEAAAPSVAAVKTPPAAVAPASAATTTAPSGVATQPEAADGTASEEAARPPNLTPPQAIEQQAPAAGPAQAQAQAQPPAVPTLPAQQPAPTAERTKVSNPRELCGARTEFALYRCMQQQCERAQWARHPQCVRLKNSDLAD
jgi:serine/threonine protein kinase